MTPGFNLKAKYIIHAVGPVWNSGNQGEEALLKSCYQASLRLAMKHGCKTMAFPLISSGIYGYPKDKAWKAALTAIRDFQKENAAYPIDVTMAVLDEEVYQMGLSLVNKEKSDESFVFFWHEYEAHGCFSQWYPASFVVEGIRYCHAEQYMMAKKALLFGDLEYYVRIMHETDPKACKALGKKVRGFEADVWDACCEEIVYHANLAKFQQNPSLRKELLNTGDALLAEASPLDKIWGIGIAADHPDSQFPDRWKGKNLLGKALTNVRKQLVAEQKKGRFTNPWLYTDAGREERLRLGCMRAEGIALHMLKKQKWSDLNAEETARAEQITCEVLSEMNFCKSADGGYIDFEQMDLERGIVINYDD